MSWSVQTFRLFANRADPGLSCAKNELTLGGVPLLIRTNSRLGPRPLGDLQQVFDAAYGANAIDAISRLPCLQSIAHALNAGDLSYAAMLSLMLRLPEIDPSRMSRLRQVDGTPVGKYDDNEDRGQRGRWTTGGGQNSSAASKPTPSRASANIGTVQGTAVHPTGRWPDKHRENPNIVPAQLGLPIPFPPLIPGGTLGSPKPRDDDILFPPFNTPDTNAGQSANTNATTNAYVATDNNPRVCPDPSYEATSVGRTAEQLNYQAQINGLPLGYHVVLNGVGYDGCREIDNTMLEGKKVTFWFGRMPDFVFQKLGGYIDTVSQALRQNDFSGGRRVEWHFSDPDVAQYWEKEFARLNFKNIDVRYTPYDEFYNYGIGKISPSNALWGHYMTNRVVPI